MNTSTSTRRLALGAALALLVSACSGSAASPSTPAVQPTQPAGTPEPSVPPSVSPGPSVPPAATPTPPATPLTTVGAVQCAGSGIGGNYDWVVGASGGPPDLESATRSLRGFRATDQIAIEAPRTGVIRDGNTVFAARWFQSSSGGWLLESYEGCGDAAISYGPPLGLVRDAMAEVVVDGLRVRGLPSVAENSVKYDQLLDRDDQLFIVDGPEVADGYDWYLVQSLIAGSAPGPYGWVAASSRDDKAWIEDARESTCPTVPDDGWTFGGLPVELLVHCFGRSDLSFTLDANISCLPEDARQVDPAWFGGGCGWLSGDACGGCGLSIAADPASGVAIPAMESGRWAVTGHFDDAAAASCHSPSPAETDFVPQGYAVHLCRTTFVLTHLAKA